MRQLERLVAVNNRQCILFRPRVTSDRNYIAIRNLDGCWSYVRLLSFHKSVDCGHVSYAIQVGQQSGGIVEQTVSLARFGCIYEGIIMHEFLHALGMSEIVSVSVASYAKIVRP